MKIMYLNPLGVAKYDDLFKKIIQENKDAGTEVHITSLNPTVGSFDNLEYKSYEALVYGDIIRAVWQASVENFDAFIIGCFYDTALLNAREISGDMIVIGPCHSSIETALTISNSFSVVLGKYEWVSHINDNIVSYGYKNKINSFRTVDLKVVEFQKDHSLTLKRLIEASKLAIEEDHSESIILGCTLESGFYRKIQDSLKVPIIDPTIAALKKAEHMANQKIKMGWLPSRQWGSKPPSKDEILRFDIFKNYIFGNRIIIT